MSTPLLKVVGGSSREGGDAPALPALTGPTARLTPLPVDREFLPDHVRIQDSPPSPVTMAAGQAMCAMIAATLLWSWFGRLDVYAEATGKFAAPSRTQVVEPVDGGPVTAIRVRDGDRVRVGQALVELDPTSAAADEATAREALATARAEVTRRRAAMDAAAMDPVQVDVRPDWPADLPRDVVEREATGLRSDLDALAASLAQLAAQRSQAVALVARYQGNLGPQAAIVDLVGEHAGMSGEMSRKGWDSRATLIGLLQQQRQAELALSDLRGSLATTQASIPVLDAQAQTARKAFVSTNATQLTTAQQSVASLVQSVVKAALKTANATMRAPIAGVVQASSVTTAGQVLAPGAQVMQVVPEGEDLEIQTYVANKDVGFVRVGQEVSIKVDTFPYTRYGTVDGVVTAVARDAIVGKQAQGQQDNAAQAPDSSQSATSASQQLSDLVFPVTVRPSKATIDVDGVPMPLTAGMTATLDIRTESRRVIDYVLSPVHDLVAGAGHER